MMQTTLNNPMASPSTLGVSNAAVFGANLSIIAFAGGFLSTGSNPENYTVGANPYSTSLLAFLFSTLSILLILGLCRLRAFSPNVVVLAGVAVGALWTAATTVLQFYATDVGLSAAVVWSFGDLGRATYKTDLIMLATVALGFVFFRCMAWRFNALLSGEATARSMGVPVEALRFFAMLAASVDTNLLSRSSYETQQRIALETAALLQKTPFPGEDVLKQMDEAFMEKNLSPGGTADLLAMTCFLYLLKEDAQWGNKAD